MNNNDNDPESTSMEDDSETIDYDDDDYSEECMDVEQDLVTKLLASPEPHKDPSMSVRLHERVWALEIKQAVEAEEELRPLSDMDYVQYAIICKGNLGNAMRRIRNIQAFKDTYQVDNSVEQAMAMLEAFMTQQAGLILHLDIDPVSLEGLHVMDIGVIRTLPWPSIPPRVPITIGGYSYWGFTITIMLSSHCCRPSDKAIIPWEILPEPDGIPLIWKCNIDFAAKCLVIIRSNLPSTWRIILDRWSISHGPF